MREARIRRGLSQNELAKAANLTSGVIVSRWELAETEPSLEMVTRVAAALNVSLDWLVNGQGRAPKFEAA